MARRTIYRVVDLDYFVQSHYFGTQGVEFGIGSELWILNLMFSCLAALRGKLRVPAKFLIAPSRVAVALAAPFGTSHGGVWIRVGGRLDGAHRQVEWCIGANQEGERI